MWLCAVGGGQSYSVHGAAVVYLALGSTALRFRQMELCPRPSLGNVVLTFLLLFPPHGAGNLWIQQDFPSQSLNSFPASRLHSRYPDPQKSLPEWLQHHSQNLCIPLPCVCCHERRWLTLLASKCGQERTFAGDMMVLVYSCWSRKKRGMCWGWGIKGFILPPWNYKESVF